MSITLLTEQQKHELAYWKESETGYRYCIPCWLDEDGEPSRIRANLISAKKRNNRIHWWRCVNKNFDAISFSHSVKQGVVSSFDELKTLVEGLWVCDGK